MSYPAQPTDPSTSAPPAPIHEAILHGEGNELIQDPGNDMAYNDYGIPLRVNVPGRRRHQKIWVRLLNGKKSRDSYTPAEAPTQVQTLSILPTQPELEGRASTEQFLVVGLVLAENPAKFVNKEAQSKASKTILEDKNLLRAIVPITERIPVASIKYYVACSPVHGLCNTRVITQDKIFFFEEIWEGVPTNTAVKLRRTKLTDSCKKHAATIQKPPEKAQTLIVPDRTVPRALEVTRSQNDANVLLMQWSLYDVSKESATLNALQKTVKRLEPDLTKRPSNAGTSAFYEFGETLKEAEAQKLIREVIETYPGIGSLNCGLIMQLHETLREGDLGHELPYQSLAQFLALAHEKAVPGWSHDQISEVAKQILKDLAIVNKLRYVAPIQTPFISPDAADSVTEHLPLLSSVHYALTEIRNFLTDQATALREQHGGVAAHVSIDDLMLKIGSCKDSTALKIYVEQVFAIHAEQLATGNDNGAGHIQDLVDILEQFAQGLQD